MPTTTAAQNRSQVPVAPERVPTARDAALARLRDLLPAGSAVYVSDPHNARRTRNGQTRSTLVVFAGSPLPTRNVSTLVAHAVGLTPARANHGHRYGTHAAVRGYLGGHGQPLQLLTALSQTLHGSPDALHRA